MKNERPNRVYFFLSVACIALCVFMTVYPFIPNTALRVTHPTTGETFSFYQGHKHRTPLNLLWAFEGLRSLHLCWRLLFLGAVVLACFASSLSKAFRNCPRVTYPRKAFVFGLVIVGGLALFSFLAVPHHTTKFYGDVGTLLRMHGTRYVPASEMLVCHVFFFLADTVTRVLGRPAVLLSFQLATYVGGVLFLIATYFFAVTTQEHPVKRTILFVGIATGGYVAQFFGYVESTFLGLSFAACMLWFMAKYLRSKPLSWHPILWLVAIMVSAFLAILSHAGMVVLAPVCLLIMGLDVATNTDRAFFARETLWVRVRAPVIFLLCFVLPLFFVLIEPFIMQDKLGNIRGGGDRIRFVPLHLDYASRPSRFLYYSMFSFWHFMEILCATIVAAAMGLFGVVASLVHFKSVARQSDGQSRRLILVCAFLSICCLSIPVLWNHDFGMWGDWNIATTYIFALNALGWLLLLQLTKTYDSRDQAVPWKLLPLLITQLYMLVGFMSQFYP